jgi:hypothetical protein
MWLTKMYMYMFGSGELKGFGLQEFISDLQLNQCCIEATE